MVKKERGTGDMDEILGILEECKVCRIAMTDEEGLYVVPVNFGYSYKDGRLTLFFHGSESGRKAEAIKKNSPEVCVELDCAHKLLESELPCKYNYAFKSVMAWGRAAHIDEFSEKIHAMNSVMRHQCGREFEFDETMMKAVSLFKIDVEKATWRRISE